MPKDNNSGIITNGVAKVDEPQINSFSPYKSPKMVDFDPEDEDYLKELRRPAVIKEDLYQVGRTQRVKQILDSTDFRDELEKLIVGGESRPDLINLKSLEQLSDVILPGGRKISPSNVGISSLHSNVVIPVADLRGVAGSKYSKDERSVRNKLACLFRLVDLSRWSQGITNTHCSLRFSEKFVLTNPVCLMNHEVTAGQLLKVDLSDCSVINPNDDQKIEASDAILNRSHFQIHAAIYRKRPNVSCILPLSTSVVSAVAAMKCGLLPLCQEAMVIGEVSCHEFQGFNANDTCEAESIADDLGSLNQVILLRNNGFLICSPSVETAHSIAYHLVLACETQIRAIHAGVDNLVIPGELAQKKVSDLVKSLGSSAVNKVADFVSAPQWKNGELEWEAWMRVLDNAGYRTGHIYRTASTAAKVTGSMATPPFSPREGYDMTDNAANKLRVDMERLRLRQQSPRTSADSKKTPNIRWVQQSGCPSPGLQGMQPIKITMNSHQFLPQTSPAVSPNPKELKEKQKKIREQGRVDNISAGPQSKILDGLSYQEAAALKQLQETMTDAQQCEKILIGAASKGIVERDHRHNAQIYTQFYQSNPFSSETEQEIQKYVDEVKQKTQNLSHSGTLERYGIAQNEAASAGSASPESVSLMQAAREHNISRSTTTPPPTRTITVKETTFDANDGLRNFHNDKVQQQKTRSQPSPEILEEKCVSEEELTD
uniref:Class II aldolase/adducin N-terminal domain-containing protein n=1 Tax=Romanomermis culicivorax TaxID=13658 RepID=A0A915IQL2_ROMCU